MLFSYQAHLGGIFDNLSFVNFHEKDYDKMTGINSREKEHIDLEKPVMAQVLCFCFFMCSKTFL